MRFFLDRNVSKQMARLIEVFDRDHEVRHLDTAGFAHDTPDIEWMAMLAEEQPRPVIVSGDGRILRNAAEAQVLARSGLTFFHLAEGWINLPWDEQAWKIIKVWPSIVKDAQPRKPSVFRVTINGKVELHGLTEELGKSGRGR